MILAAGRGDRMRPLTEDRPKPLLSLRGRPLIDWVLDRFVQFGVSHVVVNVHYKGDQVRAHLAQRDDATISISDETDMLLDTGGGVRRALPLLGRMPFFVANSDAPWFDHGQSTLSMMAAMFDPARMDALLLVHSTADAIGYQGRGDFKLDAEGRLIRRARRETVPFVFTGVQVLAPALLADTADEPFSLNLVYDRAAAQGRLFGLRHEGDWMAINTPEGLAAAERALAD